VVRAKALNLEQQVAADTHTIIALKEKEKAMSNKQSIIAHLSRIPNMNVLKPALDKLNEEELRALNQVFMHLSSERSRLKRQVRRGY